MIRQIIADFLRAVGHQVDEARNGATALAAVGACAYDLMLSDIRMPGMDGLTLLARSREIRPEMLVILMTGYGDRTISAKARGLGALDLLDKPIKLVELEALLDRV
jgi:DNA-binding NtrC family response regulator